MAVKVTPEELAEKWGRRLKGAIDDMRRGAERVEIAPGKLAAAKADKWQARISSAETKKKWQQRTGAVPVEDWRRSYIEKGLPRVAAGVDASNGKMVRFASQLIAHQNTALAKLATMPDLTIEDSINRMSTWVREMAKFELKE